MDGKYSMYVSPPPLFLSIRLLTLLDDSLMVDLDLTKPDDKTFGSVRHWLQPGITFHQGEDGGDVLVGRVEEEAVTQYLECAPGPPVSTDFWFWVLFLRSVDCDWECGFRGFG